MTPNKARAAAAAALPVHAGCGWRYPMLAGPLLLPACRRPPAGRAWWVQPLCSASFTSAVKAPASAGGAGRRVGACQTAMRCNTAMCSDMCSQAGGAAAGAREAHRRGRPSRQRHTPGPTAPGAAEDWIEEVRVGASYASPHMWPCLGMSRTRGRRAVAQAPTPGAPTSLLPSAWQ